MRLISMLSLEVDIPDEWRTRARTAYDAVKDLVGAERAKAINKQAKVWSDLKPFLEALSTGKCWYCESRQIRADKAVDHFRPKNRVAECDSDEGYWWLAFDWNNYRFACTYCNSLHRFEETTGGKGDHFPLLDEGKRGKPQASSSELDSIEAPKLLDPTNLHDVALLTFDVDGGKAVPLADKQADPIGHERVTISITVYNLNEKQLKKIRMEKMQDVREKLHAAAQLPMGDSYKKMLALIHKAISRDGEYSAAAKVMLSSLRGQYPLAQLILDAA